MTKPRFASSVLFSGACLLLLVLGVDPASGQQGLWEANQLDNRMLTLYRDGKYSEAIPLARKALELREQALGPTHPYVAQSLNNLGRILKDTAAYAEARLLFERALRINEQALGPTHLQVATTLNNLASLLVDTGSMGEARPLFERALKIEEQALEADDPQMAVTLNNLASLQKKTGDYMGALSLFERALKINERALGPVHPTVARSLNNLASLLQMMGRYVEARALYERALKISEQALGPTHLEVARTLNNLASLLVETGDLSGARTLLERALKISEQALGPVHPHVATVLGHLASIRRSQGDYAGARPLYERALKINEQAFGPSHVEVARNLNHLALLLMDTADYEGARPLLERGLLIDEQALGPMHPEVAGSLDNFAALLMDMGDIAGARPLMERALNINEQALGPTHKNVGRSLDRLAQLLEVTGDYSGAWSLYERALKVYVQALGPSHPDIATVLDHLASLLKTKEDYAGARPLYERALQINEGALGPDHPRVATSLNNLAVLLEMAHDDATAQPLLERALKIYEHIYGSLHPRVADGLNNLAQVLKTTGNYAEARLLYERALKINEQALGPQHPRAGTVLNNWADLEAAHGRFAHASSLVLRGLRLEDFYIQNVFRATTEAEKLAFVQSMSAGYVFYLSLIHQHLNSDAQALRDGLELVLRRKGVVFDAQSRTQESFKGRLSEAARKDFDRLSALRNELARLLLNKPEKMDFDIYQQKLNALQGDIESTERRLAAQSELVAKQLQQRNITVEQVSKQLSKKDVLAEFVKIRDFNFAGGRWKRSWRYLAFVLTAAEDIKLVDLGDATALEEKIIQVLNGLRIAQQRQGSAVDQSIASLNGLFSTLWAPLGPALGNAEQVFLSPDGLLNLVPFAALQDNGGHFLLERYRLAYVTNGRELAGQGAVMHQPATDLLLVANPAFDITSAKVENPGETRRSRDFRGHFGPLPGTEREADEIPMLVSGPDTRKQVVTGERATEGLVKHVRSPRILHLATHGFFLGDQDLTLDASVRGVSLVADAAHTNGTKPARSMPYENPLVRAGLAFAGANHAADTTTGDDGILTALEITSMDLQETELVVLSACETAVGKVQTGEGVFGLRRAFALAGAKNLLMSLWPVDDQVTADQMKAFYQNRRTLPPAEALRQAQLETIQMLKARFGVANPGLWAPFILQGAQALGM